MGNRVDRTGTFRFNKVLEAGVHAKADDDGNFKNVSFNVRLALSEFYDEQEGQWVPWEEYGTEIIAYLYLFGMDKKKKQIGPTLNHQQVMKVFGWDGRSFQILANDDYSEVTGQIRIKDNDPEYANKNPFQVAFIDVFDADPSSQLRKLEADDLKKLDAKFASLLQASGAAPKPVSAPVKPNSRPKPPSKPITEPKTEPKPETETTESKLPFSQVSIPESEIETAAQKKAKINAKAKKLAAKKKAAAATSKELEPPTRTPAPPDITATSAAATVILGGVTKQEAWEICVEMKAKGCSDEALNVAWSAAISEIAGDILDEEITPDQWGQIKDVVLDEVGVF